MATPEKEMRSRIVDSLEKGFESLMDCQSSYQHTKGLQHEITEEMKFSREVNPQRNRQKLSRTLAVYGRPDRLQVARRQRYNLLNPNDHWKA